VVRGFCFFPPSLSVSLAAYGCLPCRAWSWVGREAENGEEWSVEWEWLAGELNACEGGLEDCGVLVIGDDVCGIVVRF
jgi:hypothetical protein